MSLSYKGASDQDSVPTTDHGVTTYVPLGDGANAREVAAVGC
jgi:hypothetical protein